MLNLSSLLSDRITALAQFFLLVFLRGLFEFGLFFRGGVVEVYGDLFAKLGVDVLLQYVLGEMDIIKGFVEQGE